MSSVFVGTVSDFIKNMLEDEFASKKDASFLVFTPETIFFQLDEEIKAKKNEEKQLYIELVSQNFNNLLAEYIGQGKVLTDFVTGFQSELLRWSLYWQGVAGYKLTRKYPDFKLDTEHLWKFCIEVLKPANGVKFLKREYGRILKIYKREQPLLDSKKDEILKMIKDLEAIQERGTDEKTDFASSINVVKPIDPIEQLAGILQQNEIIRDKDQFIQTIKNGTGIIELTDEISVEKAGILAKVILNSKIITKKDYIVFKIKTVEYQLMQIIKAGEYELNTNTAESEAYKKTIEIMIRSSNVRNSNNDGKQDGKGLPEMLTRKETAEYLQISLTTLWKWTEENKIKRIKIGNKVFYSKEEITRFVQK